MLNGASKAFTEAGPDLHIHKPQPSTSFIHYKVCVQLKFLVLLKLIFNNLTSKTMLNCRRLVKLHQNLSRQ